MNEHPNHNQDDTGTELSFELSQLPPPHSRPPRHSRRWLILLTAGAVVVLAAVIVSNFVFLRPGPTKQLSSPPRPTASATAMPVTTFVPLGNVPANCPPGNPVTTFSSVYGPAVGVQALHVWLVGFSGPTATMRYTGSVPLTVRGWPAKILFVAAPDVTQPITLSAKGMFGITDGVWFSVAGPGQATRTLTLDPGQKVAGTDGTRSWPMNVYLPSAGCYFLDVVCGGTEAGTFFAAGM